MTGEQTDGGLMPGEAGAGQARAATGLMPGEQSAGGLMPGEADRAGDRPPGLMPGERA